MKYRDLRDFMSQLDKGGELKRVGVEVDTRLEINRVGAVFFVGIVVDFLLSGRSM